MPDAPAHDRRLPIADALQRLPLEAPDRSAWPALQRRIAAAHAPRRRRWPFALAAAAVLALAALLPGRLSPPPVAPAEVAAAPSPELEVLMAESARLEHLVSAVSPRAMATASGTLLDLEFEDRLQRIDIALSDPALGADGRAALWQLRVSLLREYAGFQGTRQYLAADGSTVDGALVATF
ncbi:MAG TPA: hypothetical protein VFQ84_12865 [Arenimonas sp.]|uniref:hypothetical protein n=1 Tax=Arenimonas sp. TaxID=1872635 RepID=UPI002D7F473D|nr:hypothetical protein [Arenimonas sp.]HEU0154225.1 hypothetical protein [Arenimonas sp.]